MDEIAGERTNQARDRRHEASVLAGVLYLHPTHITERELLLSLFAERPEVDAGASVPSSFG
ncbi:MAG: hypothetical protein JWO14_2844 [Solirubrobacterales bacterium]|nr:hypothetical protein [Solirubrobacterales bacterium]